MSIEIEIEMANDITNFEQPINKITILILILENNKIVNILKNRLTTINNRVLRKELITYSIESNHFPSSISLSNNKRTYCKR
jgi:hypothetical protein